MDNERFDELVSLSIGELREMLAYEDSETTFESFLIENGWIDDERDWDPEDEDEDEYEDEDEDWEDDELVEGSDPLDNPEEEELALGIAYDIAQGKYNLEAIRGLYSDEIIERINYLRIG